MSERILPPIASIALDILVRSGSRSMVRNDFYLRVAQRGCSGQATYGALQVFARRGWIEALDPLLTISEVAFNHREPRGKHYVTVRRTRMPSLFG